VSSLLGQLWPFDVSSTCPYIDINIICQRQWRRTTRLNRFCGRDACLCLHVQRAARALERRFDDALRPIGLTNGQFSIMMSLNRPKAPAMGAVASLLGMDRTTLTAALKPLQSRRLLKDHRGPRGPPLPYHGADAQGAQVACQRRSRLEEDARCI